MAVSPVEVFCRALWRHEHATVAALASKVDPNAKDKWGHTPLLAAAQYGDLALVKLLVLRGAELDQSKTYLTPLTLAARRGADDIVSFLRRQGAVPSIVTLIYLGAREGFVQSLKRDPALSKLRDEEGTPILHHAAQALRPDMVELLLKKGATVSDTDAGGETALHRVSDLAARPPSPPPRWPLCCSIGELIPTLGIGTRSHPCTRRFARGTWRSPRYFSSAARIPNAKDKLRGSTPLRRAVSGTGAGETAGTSALMAPLTKLLLEHGADPNACESAESRSTHRRRAPEVRAVLEKYLAARANLPRQSRKPRRSAGPNSRRACGS